MYGTSNTPLNLLTSLLHKQKEGTLAIVDLQKAIDAHKETGDFAAIQYHMRWQAASLLGEMTNAHQATRWLSVLPLFLQGIDEMGAYSKDRDAINANEDARKWWLFILWEVSRQVGRSVNPSSRSTSVASNLEEDYQQAFASQIWDGAGPEGRLAVATAEMAQQERNRLEYEERQRKQREDHLLELERKEAERKAKRLARKMAG